MQVIPADLLSPLRNLLVNAPLYFHTGSTPWCCCCCCCWLWRQTGCMHLLRIVVGRSGCSRRCYCTVHPTNEWTSDRGQSDPVGSGTPVPSRPIYFTRTSDGRPIGAPPRVQICKHLSKVDVNCSVLLLLILQTCADVCNWRWCEVAGP